jgi:hypothetical protein
MDGFSRQPSEVPVSSEFISDEELASLALAADPNAPLEPDARPWNASAVYQSTGLPEWYMPIAIAIAIGRGRGTRIVVVSIIVGFLVINAFGLCITSGFLSFA